MARVREIRGRLYAEWWDPRRRQTVKMRWRGSAREGERFARERQVEADRRKFERLDLVSNEVELAPLIAAWRAYLQGRARPRTWESYSLGLRTILGWMDATGRPTRLVSDLELDAVEAWKAEAMEKGIPPACRPMATATVARRVGALVAVLNWAVRMRRIASNPLAGWTAPRGRTRRERQPLTAFEVAKLLEASRGQLAELWHVFLHTGMRSGELRAIEWPDVDWERSEIRVRAEISKSKRTRFIPMSATVRAILDSLRLRLAERPDTEEARRWVFVQPNGRPWLANLSRVLKRCLAKAGVRRDADLHTFRHTFASELIRRGADVRTLQALLGHASARTTLEHYAHLFQDRAAEVVGLLDGFGERMATDERLASAASS